MFERFTRNAIQAIVLAQDECRGSGQVLVGVEQLLAGLLALGEGLAFEVLSGRNITLAAVRSLHNGSVSGDNAAIGGEVPLAAPAEHAARLTQPEVVIVGADDDRLVGQRAGPVDHPDHVPALDVRAVDG